MIRSPEESSPFLKKRTKKLFLLADVTTSLDKLAPTSIQAKGQKFFASFFQRRRPCLLAAMIVAWHTGNAAAAAGTDSAVFCARASGRQILAVAVMPDDRLRFGISVWSPEGSNISVYGIAAPAAGGWLYAEAGGRCSISLARDAAGGFAVRADPAADCSGHGGQGSVIGAIAFTAAQNEGSVKTELDSEEAFQHAGHCAKVS